MVKDGTMNLVRRVTVTTTAVLATAAVTAGSALAAQPAPTPAPIGPECRPNIVAAVLAALVQNGTPITPGQKIQYLQVSQRPDGSYYPELCVVTIPR